MVAEQFRKKNPFSRQALKNDELLSGKNHLDTLKNIRRILNYSMDHDNCRSFLIRGDRGTGKTSLLKILQGDAKKYNLFSVNLYLTESNSDNTINFFYGLYSNLFNECKNNEVLSEEINHAEISISTNQLPSNVEYWVFNFVNKYIESRINPNLPSNILAEEIAKDFKLVISELRRKKDFFNDCTKLAFFIDESQLIFSNKEILNIIRHLIQEEIGVVFIIASQYPHDDKILYQVFDSEERAFHSHTLGYFEEISDVEEFLKKSLENIGWKERDFKLHIKNFNQLVLNLFKLTGGKPEFVNRIADKMFENAAMGKDSKMRWTPALLSSIADNLEKQTSQVDANNGTTFNKKRAELIIDLNNDDFKWFQFLSASSWLSTPREVYECLRFFFDKNHINIENYKSFIVRLHDENVLAFEKNISNENLPSIGFNVNKQEIVDLLDLKFVYLGPSSEQYWLLIMLQTNGNRKLKFNSRLPFFTLCEEIHKIAGFEGQSILRVVHNQALIFSENGFNEGNFEENKIINFFFSLKNKKQILNELDETLVLFLYNFLNSELDYISFFSFSVKVKNNFINNYLYRLDFFDYELHQQKLFELKERFLHDEIFFEFNYETFKKEETIKIDEFIELIFTSENKAGISLLNKKITEKAIDLYLKEGQEKCSDILKKMTYSLNAIKIGEEDEMGFINNVGYIFMNLGEYSDANYCFDFVIKRYKQGYYKDKKEISDNSSLFLIFYNKAILLALENKFNQAISHFDLSSDFFIKIKDPNFAAINYLVNEDNNNNFRISEQRKSIDAFDLIEKNKELLSDFLE